MPITRLIAEGFRNLHSVDFRPAPNVNFVSGENGSGKTSILEVIYTLATGRSFRTRRFKNLISYQSSNFQVFAELELAGVNRRLGVSRGEDGASLFKLDGTPVSSAAELATLLPCQVLNSQSFALLEGGPAERRAYIDWLVFHVKPRFRRTWAEYTRCLKQRNAMLRSDRTPRSEFTVWNRALAELGEEIDLYRQQVIEDVEPVGKEYLSECEFVRGGDFEMRYQAGWDRSRSLLEQIEDRHERDMAVGHTSLGPHKGDIRFVFNKKPLVELFSRGQQKAVVSALYLAQLKVFHSSSGRDCLLLLDDLPSELDDRNIERLCRWVQQLTNVQTFVTGIELEPISNLWSATSVSGNSKKMFHVKQGQVLEQPCQWSTS
jgi:DNA replication and repair protein RecF